ncbi:MAG: DUF6268 family outer membrane beta-barrel protein [Chlamydiales bacterium]|nr:DUF6268 family outer membrane beta-barrel protein [Chlamydiales bacterium]
MKRFIPYLAVLSYAFTNMLSAEAVAGRDVEPNTEIVAVYNNINKAKFKKTHSQRHHHFKYSEGYVLGTYEQHLSSQTDLGYSVGYMNTEMKFSHHPRKTSFRENNFHNLLVQFGASTTKVENWKWNAGLGMQINTDHFKISRYTYFNGILHGKTPYNAETNLHVGLVGYSGMRFTRVLPVIGFDYEFSKRLKLNAVFPVDMKLTYGITEKLSVDAALRFMFSRQRLNNQHHNNRGLVAYRNWGAEAGVNYAFSQTIKLNLHVGETFAGRMRLSDRHDRHRKHLKLDAAMYYGLEASFAF